MSTNLLDTDRLTRILAALAGGATYQEIGDAEGISRQRACQIVKEHSNGAPLGGLAVRTLRMLELGLTQEQIAYVEDRKPDTITETFKAATGIVLHGERVVREDAERKLLRKLYEAGFSAYEIAKALGMHPSGITKRIVRAGGKMRSSTRETAEGKVAG